MHAADVTQTIHYLLLKTGMLVRLLTLTHCPMLHCGGRISQILVEEFPLISAAPPFVCLVRDLRIQQQLQRRLHLRAASRSSIPIDPSHQVTQNQKD